MKATTAFILAHEGEKAVLKQMNDCINPMIHVLAKCVEDEEDDTVLKSFVDLVEKCPQMLRPQFQPLVELCLKVISDTEKGESWRHLALEIIVSLAENAPSTVRKRGAAYLQPLGKI